MSIYNPLNFYVLQTQLMYDILNEITTLFLTQALKVTTAEVEYAYTYISFLKHESYSLKGYIISKLRKI